MTKHKLVTFEVVVELVRSHGTFGRDGYTETVTVKAISEAAARFDAKHIASKNFPFADSIEVVSIEKVSR